MRRRAWTAWALAAVGLALSVAARHLPAPRAWSTMAGLLLLTAIALAVSLLAFWGKVRAQVPPMPGLFARPRASERWCRRCGHSTPERGPCRTCGHSVSR